ncbi:MAG: pantetheine-phosphate adenylyltransferase [Bacilli bacterium]|nr:pantetheine-phosphate adenylyltransferase [Bacilli bacterium]
MMRKAVYAGSFDPITNGHLEVLKRSLKIFDQVYLLLAVNPKKSGAFTIKERLEMMKESVKELPNVIVDYYDGLTVDYCKKVGAPSIIRGLRAVTDFEYEFQLAAANEFAAPDVDMVFFMARKEENFVSSSSVLELRKGGVDVSSLVPPTVIKMFEKKGL